MQINITTRKTRKEQQVESKPSHLASQVETRNRIGSGRKAWLPVQVRVVARYDNEIWDDDEKTPPPLGPEPVPGAAGRLFPAQRLGRLMRPEATERAQAGMPPFRSLPKDIGGEIESSGQRAWMGQRRKRK